MIQKNTTHPSPRAAWLKGVGTTVCAVLGARLSDLRQEFWWILLAGLGTVLTFSTWQLYRNAEGSLYVCLIAASTAALTLLAAIQLYHHRLAKLILTVVSLLFLGAGVFILRWESNQARCYNEAMVAYKCKDYARQAQFLAAATKFYEADEKRPRLVKMLFPQTRAGYLEARTQLHLANLHLKGNKAKEAVEALWRFFELNSGFPSEWKVLAPAQERQYFADFKDAARNLEKLRYLNLDGGAGIPLGPSGPATREPCDQREPGRRPGDGGGRMPRNTL